MKRRIFVAAAGIPPEIGDGFVAGFTKTLPIMSWLPLHRSACYTESYSKDLYERLAAKLRAHQPSDRYDLLANSNLVLLYLDKNDGSESTIFERFGTEALIARMKYPDIENIPLATGNQRGKSINDLIREGRRAIGHARELLSAVAEEVTNRDNKTCLLLPPRNFGGQIGAVFDAVHNVSLAGDGSEEFKKRLRGVSRSLRTERIDGRKYFMGHRGLVFKSPGKAGARHGLAPDWDAPGGHDSSCVIQGRLRFGVSYDPKFHYDCAIPKDGDRSFPSCHGTERVPRGRSHVNIAPNDNIR